ncbi:CDGSH iron-sulfur domain-containing protein [Bradyrhizobium sp. HKCCYLS2038]|uniref:CDGSH iron-sulfur domain-containing protein n=1 Tax=unclassified Bradyrhizobium TaxID=2631580 RepID=UPI003EBAA15C
MSEPAIGGRTPLPVEVEAGKDYWWCTCGQSAKQPFCDGSHAGSSFAPMQYTAPETKKAFFCTCKRTANAPLCDGAHSKLPA